MQINKKTWKTFETYFNNKNYIVFCNKYYQKDGTIYHHSYVKNDDSYLKRITGQLSISYISEIIVSFSNVIDTPDCILSDIEYEQNKQWIESSIRGYKEIIECGIIKCRFDINKIYYIFVSNHADKTLLKLRFQ